MNKLNLNFKSTDKLNIDVYDIENGVEIIFKGFIDDKNPEAMLSSFFNEAHDKIIKSSIKYIELDFTKLIFLNSSGIKILIQWITKDATLSQDKQYYFRLKINSDFHWQENSTSMLKMLVPDLITISKE
ncbi:MAG: hypothetical protein A2086_15875 [Spirochaetes bacterium GWD1_27_9]|nr:MAG: hypothetical protein A2Z98_11145 [Spirochaetes bacterium GWB1_27_13]OHD24812.1 MAG: hypothetical protein A2Y34_08255 [Spirochaetes bacterium GWC1_27_15]OHD42857.1 MAG: hypothetical protein A2086_15875 [Spirochaetes bacterium GWD1_27_9]